MLGLHLDATYGIRTRVSGETIQRATTAPTRPLLRTSASRRHVRGSNPCFRRDNPAGYHCPNAAIFGVTRLETIDALRSRPGTSICAQERERRCIARSRGSVSPSAAARPRRSRRCLAGPGWRQFLRRGAQHGPHVSLRASARTRFARVSSGARSAGFVGRFMAGLDSSAIVQRFPGPVKQTTQKNRRTNKGRWSARGRTPRPDRPRPRGACTRATAPPPRRRAGRNPAAGRPATGRGAPRRDPTPAGRSSRSPRGAARRAQQPG